MNITRTGFTAVLAASLFVLLGSPSFAADAPIAPRDGWYNKALVGFEFVRDNVDIPPKKGVAIIDSRPAARQYDPGHLPAAINIPDTQFDKLVDKLPADKSTLLIFYCGGLECPLSHNSAFKAEKLGYTQIKVYPAGMPDWKEKGGMISVSAAHIKKLIDDKASYLLIDARHGLKAVDEEPMAAFDKAAVSYQIILTKADKLKPAEVEAVRLRTEAAIRKRPAAFPRVLATSSEKGVGIPELRAEIMSACEITL